MLENESPLTNEGPKFSLEKGDAPDAIYQEALETMQEQYRSEDEISSCCITSDDDNVYLLEVNVNHGGVGSLSVTEKFPLGGYGGVEEENQAQDLENLEG